MRVTFNSTFNQAAADIRRTSEELAARQREVSSGRRLHAPGDDPAAAAAVIRERQAIATLDQYAQAADSAVSRLSVMDSVLGSVVDRLTAARTAVLSARGEPIDQAKRDAAVNQLIGIRDALQSDLNVRLRGSYLFSGAATTTAPYVRLADGSVSPYQGDAESPVVDIDTHSAVPVAYSADAILRGADDADAFATIDAAITAIRAGDAAGLDSASASLERAFARAVAAQSRIGTDLAAIEVQRDRHVDLRRASAERVSSLEDANMVEAIARMNQADTAHRVALGAVANIGRATLMDYLR